MARCQPSSVPLPFLCLLSVTATVGIVLLNKTVSQTFHFRFPMTLTFSHFCSTLMYASLRSRAASGKTPPRVSWVAFSGLALSNSLSVGFMNASVGQNTIGFYQASKLAIIPVVVCLTAVLPGGSLPPPATMAILTVLLIGVGLVIVGDVTLNTMGCVYAAIAVMATAVAQVMLKHLYSASEKMPCPYTFMKYQYVAAVPAMLMLVFLFEGLEGFSTVGRLIHAAAIGEGSGGAQGGTSRDARMLLGVILLTNILGVTINWVQNELIGATSPLTVQVLGHFKTCLLVVGGTMVFQEPVTGRTVLGLGFAFLAMFAYSQVKKNGSSSCNGAMEMNKQRPHRKTV